MASFHITHIIPDHRYHILNGYNEVIETVIFGLRCLGHDVTYEVNRFDPSKINILFGFTLCSIDVIRLMPKTTIVYNLEQRKHLMDGREVWEAHPFIRENLVVWDYSSDNVQFWNSLPGPENNVVHVPIGYAPFLSRIPKTDDQDIDVLIYGGPTEARLAAFREICITGLRALFVHGLYGVKRDALIARSKIVLNIGQYDKIFEIVRVSYLLANRKAVVADFDETTSVEPDIIGAVRFAPLERMAEACYELIENGQARHALEEEGFNIFSRRNAVAFLAYAVSQLPYI